MMLVGTNKDARFPARGQFHVPWRGDARASLALGCRRMGCGQMFQILCCILVTIMFGSTVFASPSAGTQGKRISYNTTGMAHFGRWEPAVCLNDCRTGKWGFVGKLASNFSHGGIHHRFRKVPVGSHASDIQILDADEPESSDKPCCQLVDDGTSDVGNSFMPSGQLCLRLLPVLLVIDLCSLLAPSIYFYIFHYVFWISTEKFCRYLLTFISKAHRCADRLPGNLGCWTGHRSLLWRRHQARQRDISKCSTG